VADDHIAVVFEEIEANRKLWAEAAPKMASILTLVNQMEFRNRATTMFREPMVAHEAIIAKFGDHCRKGGVVWTKIEMTLRAAGMLFGEVNKETERQIRELQAQIEKL
jgi:hypothetical protein